MKGIILLGLVSLAFGVKLRTPGGTCPPDETGTPTYLPDLCNCNQYYECFNGSPILEKCPPDLEWNNDKKTCDWPKSAGCNTNNCEETTSPTTTNSIKSIEAFEENKCPPEDDPLHDVLFPVPGDCHSFYKCSQGVPYKIPCPSGLEWSQELQRCEWPEVANCKP